MSGEATQFEARCSEAACRVCGERGLAPVLDLGRTPLADALLTERDLARGGEATHPLEVAFCPACALVQILETAPPEEVFARDYPYYSSFSDALLQHSRDNALELIKTRGLGPQSLVIELASNDGYLLKNFVEQGVPALGIDPAEGPAKAAEKIGVPTINDFFTESLARCLAHQGRRADVVIANNVLAHVADTNGFVRGIATVLRDDGVAVIEAPYLGDLIAHCEFDTIYHEHLCYFSLSALDHLFRRNGLFLNDARRLAIHGGSLRLYVGKRDGPSEAVRGLLAEERRAGMTSPTFYADFAQRVEGLRASLRETLDGIKARGERIAAYAASAKGATLLNYCGVGRETIDFVVDRNVHKQGKFMPGAHLPIRAPEALLDDAPAYALLLAWNFADEILEQQKAYRAQGGKFIIPVPEVKIV